LSKSSSRRPEPLDLERDLPVTEEDRQVLYALRWPRVSGSLEHANRFCTPRLGRLREQPVERPTFAGSEPFEL